MTPPPAPPSLATIEALRGADLEVALWLRIEQLELWAARAWARCSVPIPPGTSAEPADPAP